LTEQETAKSFNDIDKSGWTPAADLSDIKYVVIKDKKTLSEVPNKPGAYWLVTTELINHAMHNHLFPAKIKEEKVEREIVYNGVAQDLRKRCAVHLLREKCEGMSGISVDLFTESANLKSHVKKAFSTNLNAKVPFINGTRALTKADLNKMNLSQEEKDYVAQSNNQEIFLWNGINVSWPKHINHEWRMYYYECDHSMSSFIEIKWRERNHNPKLNSYIAGR